VALTFIGSLLHCSGCTKSLVQVRGLVKCCVIWQLFTKAGGPLVGCSRLLIRYYGIYRLYTYLEAFPRRDALCLVNTDAFITECDTQKNTVWVATHCWSSEGTLMVRLSYSLLVCTRRHLWLWKTRYSSVPLRWNYFFMFSQLNVLRVCRQEQEGLVLLHTPTILMCLDIFRGT
jgi:hypothetical protein